MTRKNNQTFKLAGIVLACAAITACDQSFENPVGDSSSYNKGTADFSQFVTLGDSLTAGYGNDALYLHGQQNSYPAILAQQFGKVDTVTFTQPLVNDDLGGLVFLGAENPSFGTKLVLNIEPKNPPDDLSPKGPEPIAGTPTTEVLTNAGGVFYNNVGVPGAKSFNLVSDKYANPAGLSVTPPTANPYFIRFASAQDTTMLADATAQSPTFYILWVGNNDVLSYATSGGTGIDRLGDTNSDNYLPNDITDPTLFANIYNQLTTTFTNAKGVLLNIPDISSLPYFTTVPFNPVPLDQETATKLNDAYAPINNGLASLLAANAISQDEHDKRLIAFAAGLTNAVVIEDESLIDLTGSGLPSIRQATANDLLILTSSSKIGTAKDNNPLTVWGLSQALEDGDVLIPTEIALINTARLAFNNTIKTTADANPNLAFVDVEAIMSELSTTGVNYGTGTITSTYATGRGFSLDGVHPTARGYSHIANQIISVINSDFGANIPPVNPNDYSTIFFKE